MKIKSFKEFLTEQAAEYTMGQSVKVDLMKLKDSGVDVNELGGFDYGTIEAMGGSTYDLRFPNGAVVKVNADSILSVGDGDVTP